ncbi:hypothetical protein FF1_006931 [Malus domestica]
MCVFQLPNKLCNEIDAVVVRFWWAGADEDCGIHWINWAEMGRPKRDGGMGFRNLKDFNIALFIANFEQAEVYILDNWVPSIPSRHSTLPLHSKINKETRVAMFIDPVLKDWNFAIVSELVPEVKCIVISNIHAGPLMRPNKLVWLFEKNGTYSMKSGYRWCHNRHPQT